jgi:O-antigen/teichoic acid export membrane protein
LRDVRWPTMVGRSGARARTLPMAQNSVALILAKVATMGLGFLFWLVAARLFSPADVGLASGAVSAMMLITQLALFGVGSAVISLYPSRKDDPSGLLDGALTIVSGAALLGAAIFLVLAATVLQNLQVVAEQPLFAIGFALMCVLGTAGIVLDQTSTVLRRGDQVLVRGVLNGVVSLIGLPLVLLLPSGEQAQAIFDVWVFGAVVMCAWAG